MTTEPVASEGRFPIVGIGASAGGLAAFEAFFSGLAPDVETGVAFVLVQHLDPDHKSLLADIVRRYTSMEVFEVTDGLVVKPDCTYIIPPGNDLALHGGRLQLLAPAAPRGQRLPIDFFFESLAQDLGEKAVAVVLSGTGSDGTVGIRAVKAAGGLVLAQGRESAEYSGMPASALETGLVDIELPPDQMPGKILAYLSHASAHPLSPVLPDPLDEDVLRSVFTVLRGHAGHDFSQYKPNTVNRRIVRRMAVHQIDALEGYLQLLEQDPSEVDALFQDLLIGVTNFFRDPEAFQKLAGEIVPALVERKEPGTIRIWSVGCSTGEEAYSVAMVVKEHLEARKLSDSVQIFATDIDPRAIAQARTGVYPAGIAADLTPERLARFFVSDPGPGYRIRKSIRDMIIFSEQDVVRDPPFTKLDLIVCRNLLIYLGPELQKKLIPLFHYALSPGGVLFLGTSESVGEYGDLFLVVDRKAKFFRRQEHFAGARRTPLGRFLPPLSVKAGPRAEVASRLPPRSLREVTEEALVLPVAPAAALVGSQGDILYLHGRTGAYLEPTPGVMGTNNILKMAREGLRHELTLALRRAVESRGPVRCSGLKVQAEGRLIPVDVAVRPVPAAPESGSDAPLFLVTFEDADPNLGDNPPNGHPDPRNDHRVEVLQQELRAQEEALKTTNDQLESANEELRSSNEEMQSVNEELQSTNEELETSKEELQSLNEELATVNVELQTKVVDLSQANNDMNNLLSGTGIATLFVDSQLRILRFTPAATRIIHLIPSDLGRPVSHLASSLVGYHRLLEDAKAVLDTLVPVEVEVQIEQGSWFTLRIQPYRTLENVVKGAVFTFTDITEVVAKREALRKANELARLAVVVRDSSDAITVQDLDGRILAWNPGAEKLYGWTEAEALGHNVLDRIPEAQREQAMARIHELSRSAVLEPYRCERIAKDGKVVPITLTSTALIDGSGRVYAIATTERRFGG